MVSPDSVRQGMDYFLFKKIKNVASLDEMGKGEIRYGVASKFHFKTL